MTQAKDPAHREGGLAALGRRLLVLDSITEAVGTGAGCIVVSGSHGGLSAGRFALDAQVWLAVFNDAGGGKDAAGIAALALLQAHGIAACTVAHTSARIGEAQSTLEGGVISQANAAARAAGAEIGGRLAEWLRADPAKPAPGAGTGTGA